MYCPETPEYNPSPIKRTRSQQEHEYETNPDEEANRGPILNKLYNVEENLIKRLDRMGSLLEANLSKFKKLKVESKRQKEEIKKLETGDHGIAIKSAKPGKKVV